MHWNVNKEIWKWTFSMAGKQYFAFILHSYYLNEKMWQLMCLFSHQGTSPLTSLHSPKQGCFWYWQYKLSFGPGCSLIQGQSEREEVFSCIRYNVGPGDGCVFCGAVPGLSPSSRCVCVRPSNPSAHGLGFFSPGTGVVWGRPAGEASWAGHTWALQNRCVQKHRGQ